MSDSTKSAGVDAWAGPGFGPPQAPARASRSRRRLAALVSICVVGGAAVLVVGTHAQKPVSPIVAQVALPASVVGLGFLEPSSTILKVGAPGSPDAARVATLGVAEGDEVQAGQVIATLDTAAKLAVQVEASSAQVQLKRLMLEKQRIDIAYAIETRRSALVRAHAELESTQADFLRQQSLVSSRVVAVSVFEKARKDFLTARATVVETEAALRRVEAAAKTPRSGQPIPIDLAVTEQELAAAEADLRFAQANLADATVHAPISGRVLAVKARPGERVGSDGGLLELGATRSMRAVIEVYETDIGRVRLGQTVVIQAEALQGDISGTVERIGAAVKRQSVINNDPATATDARVVEVFVALDGEASRRVGSLSRLQVQGVFRP